MYDGSGPAGPAEPKGVTESERILNVFDSKIQTLDKITGTLVANVTALGGFELLKGTSSEASKAAQGGNFIGELNIRLEKLQSLIDGLDAIRINLGRLV